MSGIEIVGLAASVIQIADIGGKLSVKLFTFTRKVKNANKSIDALSQDIAATGAVLKQLGETLSKDKSTKVCSQEAIDAAKTLVEDTKKVFTDLEKLIDIDEKPNSNFLRSINIRQRLKFAFLQPQIEQVQANLERLKSSLLVILNVLIFAEQLRNQEALPLLQDQRELIKVLAAEKDENEKRHEQILKALSDNATVYSLSSADIATDLAKGLDHNLATISSASTLVTDNVSSPSVNLMSQPRSKDVPTVASIDLPPGLKHHQQRIQHHSKLVQNLLSEIKSLRYDLDHGTRDRMHSGVLAIHWNEWAAQRRRHGHEGFLEILEQHVDVARYWRDHFFLDEIHTEDRRRTMGYSDPLPTSPAYSPASPAYSPVSESTPRAQNEVEDPALCTIAQPQACQTLKNNPHGASPADGVEEGVREGSGREVEECGPPNSEWYKLGDGVYGVSEYLDEGKAVFARAGIAEEEEEEAEQETKAQEEERVKEEDVPQRKEVEGSGDQRQGQAEVKRAVLRGRPRKVRGQALRSCRMVDSDASESAEGEPDDELPMQSLQLVGKKRKAVEVEDELEPNLDKHIEREAKAHPNSFRETAAGRAWERIPTRNTDTGPYLSGRPHMSPAQFPSTLALRNTMLKQTCISKVLRRSWNENDLQLWMMWTSSFYS